MLCETEQIAYIQLITDFLKAIVPIVISLAVAYVVWQQHKLAKERFKLDLFEKRYAVYKGTQKFILSILRNEHNYYTETHNILAEFREHTQDTYFLFDKEIFDYLDMIDGKLVQLFINAQECDRLPVGKERSVLCNKESQLLNDLTDELPKLKEVFAPYLKFENWK